MKTLTVAARIKIVSTEIEYQRSLNRVTVNELKAGEKRVAELEATLKRLLDNNNKEREP